MTQLTVVAATLAAGLLAAPAPSPSTTTAPSTAPSPPMLSIAVDNGRTSVTAGDQVTYTIRVRNLGNTEAKQLQISQTMPAGLTLVSADAGGTPGTGNVAWTIDLGSGQESTLTTVATVGSTPGDLLRLATVACAAADSSGKPLVCATHSDLLPAGATAAGADRAPDRRLWYAGAGVLALAVLAALVLQRRRLRRLLPRWRRPAVSARPTGPSTTANDPG